MAPNNSGLTTFLCICLITISVNSLLDYGPRSLKIVSLSNNLKSGKCLVHCLPKDKLLTMCLGFMYLYYRKIWTNIPEIVATCYLVIIFNELPLLVQRSINALKSKVQLRLKRKRNPSNAQCFCFTRLMIIMMLCFVLQKYNMLGMFGKKSVELF